MKITINLYLTFAFFLVSNAAFNQPKCITFDLKDKAWWSVPDKIRKGEDYQIVVKGINLNLYKVSINAKDSMLSTGLTTPTFGNLQLDAIATAIAGITPTAVSVSKSLGESIEAVEEYKDAMEGQKFNLYKAGADVPIDQNIMGVDGEMAKQLGILEDHLSNLMRIAREIDDLNLKVHLARLSALRAQAENRNFDFNDALQFALSIRKDLGAIKESSESSKAAYKEFSNKYEVVILSRTSLKETNKKINDAYTQLGKTLDKAQTAISADKVNDLLSSILFLENNRNSDYKSLPIQFKGDQTTVTLTITPRNEDYLLQTYKTEFSFPISRKRFVAIGLSFYGAKLFDRAYSTVGMPSPEVDTLQTFSVVEEEVTEAEFGLASLIRFGTKLRIDKSEFLGIHLSVGPGVSISDDVKARVLYGGGFTLGEKHMFAVDLGAITGNVDRLSNTVNLTDQFSERPERVVVSQLKTAFFYSVGYLFRF